MYEHTYTSASYLTDEMGWPNYCGSCNTWTTSCHVEPTWSAKCSRLFCLKKNHNHICFAYY